MEFTEKQVFEALGIEPEEPAGGENTQEVAAPATQETTSAPEQGKNEREVAGPTATEGTSDGDDTAQEAEKPPMSEAQRREAAARRRRQEQQAAVDQAIQAERARAKEELEVFFQSANLKNTITGQPITSMEEFQEWRRAYDATQLQQDLKAGRLTPEALDKAVSETPAMRKVREMVERDEQARREQSEAAAQQRITAELAEIQKLDPTIGTVEDILQMPTAREFYTYVTQNHLSYLDAFRLANGPRLAQRAAETARVSAMNSARSKDHMTATKPQGAGAATVPSDQAKLFKVMNPDATDREIQEYFNKHYKS